MYTAPVKPRRYQTVSQVLSLDGLTHEEVLKVCREFWHEWDILEAFQELVELAPPPAHSGLSEPCWLWTGRLVSVGYAAAPRTQRRLIYMHRWAFEYFKHPIPKGLEIDHLCHVKRCINPTHLEAVTHAENMRRAHAAAGNYQPKTQCKRGHVFTVETTYFTRHGARQCRVCARERARKAYQSKTAAAAFHRSAS